MTASILASACSPTSHTHAQAPIPSLSLPPSPVCPAALHFPIWETLLSLEKNVLMFLT